MRVADGSLLLGSVLNFTTLLANNAAIAITDFGGATGDLGSDFLAAYPAARYTVVENPTLAALMLGRSPVNFATKAPAQCDIFYSSGTLQYLGDPMAVLAQGFSSARISVALARNSFSDAERFYVQKSRLFDNGGGPIPTGYTDQIISYPHRTLIEANVLRMAEKHGFRCIAALDENKTFPRSYGKQLVFLRS